MFSMFFRLSRTIALFSTCLLALHTPSWRQLLNHSPLGMARAHAVGVQRGVEVQGTGYFRVTNSRTCTEDLGSWTVNTPPTNGTLRFALVPLIFQDFYGNPCTIYADVPFYTFTNPTATSDFWAATWTDSIGSVRYSGFGATIAAPFKKKCDCPSCPCDGDPVSLATGALTEHVSDYATAGPNRLTFERYYNYYPNTGSFGNASVPSTFTSPLGLNWKSNYDRFLRGIYDASDQLTVVVAERLDGTLLSFAWNGSQWVPDSDVDAQLIQSGITFTLVDSDDTAETYGSFNGGNQALLTSIRSRNGYTQSLQYNSNNQLTEVTDSYGRSLLLAYQNGLLATVTTPDGLTLSYNYTASGLSGSNILDRLASVAYSTSPTTSLTYLYENTTLPTELTGIVDENGNRFGTWSYDSYGRTLSSEHAGGADLASFSYSIYGYTTATNALSQPTKSWFTEIVGAPKVNEIDRLATTSTAAASRLINYDNNGYVSSETDWNGNQTTYVNDARGLPTQITEAAGTAQQRVTNTTWLPNYYLPSQIVAPGLTTSFTYDASGDLLSKTETDTTGGPTNGQTRTWTYTWANFLPASVTDPRRNTTRFAWDASGALVSITNALGQKTTVTQHTGGGLPLVVIDPNGVETDYAYDGRNRLISSTVHTGEGLLATSNTYDPAGNLIQVTLPDGSALAETYDGAHRLVGTADLFNNQIDFALDGLGDLTQTTWSVGNNPPARTRTASFDALGRTLTDVGGVGQTTSYAYDSNGNRISISNPLGRVTTEAFDPLNRLVQITDPAHGVTSIAYDPQDHPIQFTDPNGNATSYVYDGFGDLIGRQSPDSGTTVYKYDADGNLVRYVDARGAVAEYSYDALDRLVGITYPASPTEKVRYVYDQKSGGFGVGRLTSVADQAGTLARVYDERGNVLEESRKQDRKTFVTKYAYDAASRLTGITYPDGLAATYARDAMGRIASLAAVPPAGNSPTAILGSITYQPFGPISGLAYGNDIAESRQFDADYRLTSLVDSGTSSSRTLSYGYDAADNVVSLADNVAGNQSFAYDVLNRLTGASGSYGTFDYSYDPVGNVLSIGQSLSGMTANEQLTYLPHGNQLAAIALNGSTVRSFVYSRAGNVTQDKQLKRRVLKYDEADRLSAVKSGGRLLASYVYDGFGERAEKHVPNAALPTTAYRYDLAGNLLAEAALPSGKPAADYLYLDSRPVAMFTTAAGFLFTEDDRLGTPQTLTAGNQGTVWAANYEPYGKADLQLANVTQNLRLPGQFFDAETGYHHNGFRDYDPTIGRYLETDPVGLSGGSNTYAYVANNPYGGVDPLGLCRCGQAPVDLYLAYSNIYGGYHIEIAGYDSATGRYLEAGGRGGVVETLLHSPLRAEVAEAQFSPHIQDFGRHYQDQLRIALHNPKVYVRQIRSIVCYEDALRALQKATDKINLNPITYNPVPELYPGTANSNTAAAYLLNALGINPAVALDPNLLTPGLYNGLVNVTLYNAGVAR